MEFDSPPSRSDLLSTLPVVVGFLLGAATTVVVNRFRDNGEDSSSYDADGEDEDESEDDDGGSSSDEPHKLVLCVRTDLKMQKGKIAAQVGHATLGAYKSARKKRPNALRIWEENAQPKIALQVPSLEQARRLEQAAKRQGLTTFTVFDAGRTQIAAGSMTVLAVGPGPASVVDKVTGSLKLL